MQGETYHQEQDNVVGAARIECRIQATNQAADICNVPFLKKEPKHDMEHESPTEQWKDICAGHEAASWSLVRHVFIGLESTTC